jgi:hypothetical protein
MPLIAILCRVVEGLDVHFDYLIEGLLFQELRGVSHEMASVTEADSADTTQPMHNEPPAPFLRKKRMASDWPLLNGSFLQRSISELCRSALTFRSRYCIVQGGNWEANIIVELGRRRIAHDELDRRQFQYKDYGGQIWDSSFDISVLRIIRVGLSKDFERKKGSYSATENISSSLVFREG